MRIKRIRELELTRKSLLRQKDQMKNQMKAWNQQKNFTGRSGNWYKILNKILP
jgi:transcriptional regulator with GAF, ATPase, and Fis domain